MADVLCTCGNCRDATMFAAKDYEIKDNTLGRCPIFLYAFAVAFEDFATRSFDLFLEGSGMDAAEARARIREKMRPHIDEINIERVPRNN
jgi:hypothetical protein